jgi:mRNA interferase MazF
LVVFPNTDLQPAKRRPALIVYADQLQTGLPQVLVAMITSTMARAHHPSRVVIRRQSAEGQQAGLLTETDTRATIIHTALARRIGTVAMPPIEQAVRHTFALV